MESHRIPSITWSSYYNEKTIEELKYSLRCTTFELETTRLAAQEEIQRREEEIKHLKDLLNRVVKERDEVIEKYQGVLLQQQQKPVVVQEEEGRSEESIVCESPVHSIETIGPLPEKGKLLQAVMRAGPLLQTLLLAGPLPQWRHPPPPLDAIEIPPVMPAVENKLERSVSITERKRSCLTMGSNWAEEDQSAMNASSPPLGHQPEGFYSLSHPASFHGQ